MLSPSIAERQLRDVGPIVVEVIAAPGDVERVAAATDAHLTPVVPEAVAREAVVLELDGNRGIEEDRAANTDLAGVPCSSTVRDVPCEDVAGQLSVETQEAESPTPRGVPATTPLRSRVTPPC